MRIETQNNRKTKGKMSAFFQPVMNWFVNNNNNQSSSNTSNCSCSVECGEQCCLNQSKEDKKNVNVGNNKKSHQTNNSVVETAVNRIIKINTSDPTMLKHTLDEQAAQVKHERRKGSQQSLDKQ